jgi:hypothetical protein
MRSRVADEEIWRQRSERFNVVAAAAGKQKIRRSRVVDNEMQRQKGERFSVVVTEPG